MALIHHIELADAGWSDRLAEQLIQSALLRSATPLTPVAIKESLQQDLKIAIDSHAFDRSVTRLVSRQILVVVANDALKLSEAARTEIRSRVEAVAHVENQAREKMLALLAEHARTVPSPGFWERFCQSCLEPLVAELGARTYEMISGQSMGMTPSRSMTAFLEAFPVDVRRSVSKTIDCFLEPSEVYPRQFVLQRLHAHLLSLAASLPESTVVALSKRLRSTVQLRILLDTNFLFSLLKLHDNPANDAATDLLGMLELVRSHVHFQFYASPLTVDEAKRTLANYERRLSDMPLTPRLGDVAARGTENLSGITRQYFAAVRAAKHRLTAKEYFAPYINDLLTILRRHGIELYNENVDSLTVEQDVIDDILDQQRFEEQRYGEAAKSYEALRHDVALWHIAHRRRPVALEAPLDAVFWVVTVDYRLLGFDAYKQRRIRATLPVCIHPTVLIQMLQLWLPRSQELDAALLHGMRSLIPHFFDAGAEDISLRILRALSRFEDVDDLPEDTVTQLLMNSALRRRLGAEDEVDAQIVLVRDAIIEETGKVKGDLARERTRKEELQQRLVAAEQAGREFKEKVGADQDRAAREKEALANQLMMERDRSTALEERLGVMEAALDTFAAANGRQRMERQRRALYAFGAGALTLGVALVIAVPWGADKLAVTATYSLGKSRILVASLFVLVWVFVSEHVGNRLEAVRAWSLFGSFHAVSTKLLALAGAIVVGLVTNVLWEIL